MTRSMKKISWIAIFIALFVPSIVLANYFTQPVDITGAGYISSYFDHDGSSATTMTKYTGEIFSGVESDLDTCSDYNNGAGCYDEHNGTDFATTTGADILAPNDGTVEDIWFNTCGGWQMHVWHATSGLSTLYSHLSGTTTSISSFVPRYQHIAEVGSTGSCSGGAHLHFGVTNGYSTSTSTRIDPYGWWDESSSDPWPNKGYLWTTDPPSFSLAKEISSDITASTTWRGNIVVDGNLYIFSSSTLSIEPGTIIKFKDQTSGINVNNGTLRAIGSSTRPIYFTSYKDDSVGGDTNGDSNSTSPGVSNWRHIIVTSTGSTTIAHAIMRYGGYASGSACAETGVIVCNYGGRLNLFNTDISDSDSGARMISGTTTITSSDIYTHYIGLFIDDGFTTVANNTIRDNAYGIFKESGGTLVLTDNTFTDNTSAAMYISYNLAPTFIHSGNTATGTGMRGFSVEGPITSNQTLEADGMPYIFPYGLTVNSGKTLTINPGAVLKFVNAGDAVTVSGTLDVRGSSSTPVYFTSLKDDLAGGDTNADDDDTSPSAGDWQQIIIDSTGSSTINGAVVRYGGDYSCCGGSGALINNNGGHLTVSDSRVSTSSAHGILANSGTTTVYSTEVNNNLYGITLVGGTSAIVNNNIHNNSVIGMYSFLSSTTTVENSYWGASSGPYHSTLNPSGTGDSVGDYIDFDPWLTSWP